MVCEITSFETLREFKIQLNLPQNLYCKEHSKEARSVKKGEKIIFQLYASNERFPYERELTLMVRYESNESRKHPSIFRRRALCQELDCHHPDVPPVPGRRLRDQGHLSQQDHSKKQQLAPLGIDPLT